MPARITVRPARASARLSSRQLTFRLSGLLGAASVPLAAAAIAASGTGGTGGTVVGAPLQVSSAPTARLRPASFSSAGTVHARLGGAGAADQAVRQQGDKQRAGGAGGARGAATAASTTQAASARIAAARSNAARASRNRARAALQQAEQGYTRPTSGPLTQGYGSHPGIDLAPPYGTPVVAAHAGVVTFAGWQGGYGLHVEVTQADGYLTTYSHLSATYAGVGQLVQAGTPVGAVGTTGYSTGPHLHFEVMLPGRIRTDPAAWLIAHGAAV